MKIVLGLLFLALLFGCGSTYEKAEVPPDGTGGGGSGGGGDSAQQLAWDQTVKPIITANCALVGCHKTAGFVKTLPAFLGSGSKAQVSNGRMPKGRTLSRAQKNAILNL